MCCRTTPVSIETSPRQRTNSRQPSRISQSSISRLYIMHIDCEHNMLYVQYRGEEETRRTCKEVYMLPNSPHFYQLNAAKSSITKIDVTSVIIRFDVLHLRQHSTVQMLSRGTPIQRLSERGYMRELAINLPNKRTSHHVTPRSAGCSKGLGPPSQQVCSNDRN